MNPWTKLSALLAPGAKQIVVVTVVNSDGTSLVKLRDDTEIKVTGDTVSVGDKAFIQAGKIIGKAPDLPTHSIEV